MPFTDDDIEAARLQAKSDIVREANERILGWCLGLLGFILFINRTYEIWNLESDQPDDRNCIEGDLTLDEVEEFVKRLKDK